jgi:hypothetical protein
MVTATAAVAVAVAVEDQNGDYHEKRGQMRGGAL